MASKLATALSDNPRARSLGSNASRELGEAAFLDFKDRKLAFLNSLPQQVKTRIARSSQTPFARQKHHIRYYGCVGLVLAGVKPCVLFAMNHEIEMTRDLVAAAMQPVMEAQQLESSGFILQEIRHPLLTDNPVHPGFQWGWVLANRNHQHFNHVQRAFLQPFNGGRVPEVLIGIALGYPVRAGNATLAYVDATESHEQQTCCVPVVEYFATEGPEGFPTVLQHFGLCADVWAALGRNLTIDVQPPTLECLYGRNPGGGPTAVTLLVPAPETPLS